MLAPLRDPAWLAVGFASLAILVALAVYVAQRQRKRISYEILGNIPLLTIAEENLGGLELVFRGGVVKNSRLFITEISNSGNVPIQPTDYEAPISINFGEGPQVLSAAITRRLPANLSVGVEFSHAKVTFSASLLNSGDSFTTRALISNYEKKPEFGCRIAGMNNMIDDGGKMGWLSSSLLLVGVLMLFAGLISIPLTSSPECH
jgi:hypothetical protein